MTHKEALKICEREAPSNDCIYRDGWKDGVCLLDSNPQAEYELPEHYTRYDEGVADCFAYFNDLMAGSKQ